MEGGQWGAPGGRGGHPALPPALGTRGGGVTPQAFEDPQIFSLWFQNCTHRQPITTEEGSFKMVDEEAMEKVSALFLGPGRGEARSLDSEEQAPKRWRGGALLKNPPSGLPIAEQGRAQGIYLQGQSSEPGGFGFS